MEKIVVLWGSKKFNLEVDKTKSIEEFMTTLQELTGVPIKNQKVLIRRNQIRINNKWSDFNIKNNEKILLIGSPDLSPQIIEEENAIPDTTSEISSNNDDTQILIGLKNLGNTCYMNSVFQVFRMLDSVNNEIKSIDQSKIMDKLTKMIVQFYNHFPENLDELIDEIRKSNSYFNQKDKYGFYQQQDAAEFWSYIISLLSRYSSKINDLFQIQFQVSSTGSDDVNYEVDDRLKCYIDSETTTIEQGISFDSNLEINGNIISKHKEITKLPDYLTIQLMRFDYKTEESIVAKKVRNIEHPLRIDIIKWVSQKIRSEIIDKREQDKESKDGYYCLKAIITHRGRTANSGHYIAHTRKGNKWYCFDDEKTSIVNDESRILQLNGGADWHCSYILVYEKEKI